MSRQMISETDVAFSQPKLPAIGGSRSLVSQPDLTTFDGSNPVKNHENPMFLRPKSDEVLNNDDVQLLLQQVTRVFVSALQQNSYKSWSHLCEILDIVKPYVHFLAGFPQIVHYVKRVCQMIEESDDEIELKFVLHKLSAVFATEFSLAQEGIRPTHPPFPSGSGEESLFTPRNHHSVSTKGVRVPRGDSLFPGGRTYVFDKSDGDMRGFGPKPLCLEDLKRCLPRVVREIAMREATLGGSLGTTVLALDTDLPQTRVPTPPLTPKRPSSFPGNKIPKVETGQVSQISESRKARVPKTGREVVEEFVKGSFLGEVKFAFLNVAPSIQYDPYNLVVVPEDKVNPEHYVISSHCVLHVNPHGPSESKSLDEWYGEMCVFRAVLSIGFFKNFLITKMFRKWKDIKKLSHFLKVEAEIERSLLANVPSFGSALLRISSLLQDLEKVTFLPFQINFSYQLDEFEEQVFRTYDVGYQYIEKFFRYCQMIVDKTQESCLEYLEYCEGQVKNHRHNYHESIAIAKKKRTVRERNLKLARDEVKRLNRLVCLVDHQIVSNLLRLVQSNISKFVNEVMPGPRPERDGLFTAEIVVGVDHKLKLSPSVEQFAHSVDVALKSVISTSCSLSHAMKLGSKAVMSDPSGQNDGDQKAKDDVRESNGFAVQNHHWTERKERKPGGDIDDLIYNMRKDSETVQTGSHPLSYATAIMTPESDEAKTALPVTRTDGEIHKDLDGLNSDLHSTRDMSGEASQELCVPQNPNGGLVVEGQRFQEFASGRSPLTKEKLMQVMLTNKQIKEGLIHQANLIAQASKEVEQFCDDHNWVAEIHEVVSSWGNGSTDSWRGQPAIKIEQQLIQVKAWREQVSSMTKSFCTENGIFFVDCREVQVNLLPRLTAIFKKMAQMLIADVVRLSDELIKDVDKLKKKLTDKSTDIKGFADFMESLANVREHVPTLKEKVEYIKNLYEVIRSCYRVLTPEEEVREEKVWATWEGFLFVLQEAVDFMEINKSFVREKLLEIIISLEQSASQIGEEATSGKFLDPNENPSAVLQAIRELKEKFVSIRDQLLDLSKCHAIIIGNRYDLKHVTDIQHAIEKRQELWRCFDVSSYTIREWMQTVFRKMSVQKALDKVNEWNTAGKKLKQHLPVGDRVLQSWTSQLEEFSQELPFLLQLSSDALKLRHWRALFIGMGQDYDPSWNFTVADLLSSNLGRYKDLITTICAGAAAEYALEQQLNRLIRAWQEKDFKLAKHIPLLRPRVESERKKSAKEKRKNVRPGHTAEHKTTVKVKPKTPASMPDMFILIGIGELKCIIEDNLVTLHTMLTSPHVADLKPLVETWISFLQEIENITDIWADCQKKWLYLSNVFMEPEIRKTMADNNNSRFQEVDERYREFVQVILKDPKVLSAVSLKKRGEKGWRELQGEALRDHLLELNRKEEELIRLVRDYIEDARVGFPRLFFLSDNDLLSLLAWSRNPKDLLSFVRKCFPGVKNLQFALPKDGNLKLTSSLDTALNAHLLQVTALEGSLGEVVPLLSVIPASPRPQGWLATLEHNMRNTLVRSLAECVKRRLEKKDGAAKLLELLTTLGPQISCSDHIMVKFPSQCVLTAEAVLRNQDLTEALQSGNMRELFNLRNLLGSYVDDLSSAIRKNLELKGLSTISDRLESVLASLVALAINRRDTVVEFINNGITDVHSFEWISQLRHQIETKQLIGSSYQGEPKMSSGSSRKIPINRTYEIGLCTLHQLGSSFVYSYEYLGPTSRLVMTPLTQRCFLALTMALRSHYCGVPVGIDGIGKTETIKDLSKAFGRHLVMLNCSEQVSNFTLLRNLYGMVCSGSWACFENVDCLGSSVLSILGEHLSTIATSLKCLKKFGLSQYTARGISKTDRHKDNATKRRSSVTTLSPLSKDAFSPNYALDTKSRDQCLHRKRHLSVSKGSDLQDGDFYRSDSPHLLHSLDSQGKLPETFQDTEAMEHKRQPSTTEFQMPFLGSIILEGKFLPASAMYGCFMTMSGTCSSIGTLPDNFRAQLRPISMLFPDGRPVVEVWLVCCGFTEAKALAVKMDIFFKLISQQVSHQPQYSFGLRSMKMVTHLAGKQLEKDMARKRRPTVMSSVMEEPTSNSKSVAVSEVSARSLFLENLETRQSEENAIVHSLFTYFGNKLLIEDKALFSKAVDGVFAHSVLMSVATEGDSQLIDEIKEHLRANGLQVKQEVVSKILQLHTSLETNRNVILLGCPGSGKSTLYTTLASAQNKMSGETPVPVVKTRRQTFSEKRTSTLRLARTSFVEVKEAPCPRVDLSIVFPKSLTCEELFGSLHPESGVWVDGLVSKWLRDSTLTCDTMAELLKSQSSDKQRIARMLGSFCHVKKWFVFDGPMDDTWLENMGTLLDSTRALNLANGETITQPGTVSLLFEVTELLHVSPALVTRCGVVHCPENTVGWKAIFKSWIKGAHSRWDITNRGLGIISSLMDHAVDSTLKFLGDHCQPILTEGYAATHAPSKTAAGIYEVQTLLGYLSAIFDRHILREDEESAMQMISLKQGQSISSISSRQSSGISASDRGRVTSSFAFAFVWSFGGHLHERYATKFSEHARQLLSSGPYPVLVPPDGSVYDYCLDFTKGGLVKWEERPAAIQHKTLPSSFTIVTELDRYFYLIDLILSTRQPVLLVGESGIGKTSLVQNLIIPRYNSTRICLSPGLTSKLLQEAVEYKLQQLQRKEMNHLAVQKSLANAPTRVLPGARSVNHLFFLDDLNCANSDSFGIQPPLELLRQILSQGTMYNKQRYHLYRVQNLQFMAACVPPGASTSGGGVAAYPISHRLSRLMTIVSFFPLASESLRSVYSAVFLAWLEEFPAYSLTHHEQLAQALSSASIKMYNVIRQKLRPTPLHPHFLFTQHELSRVVQGMSLLSSKSRGRPRPRGRRRTEIGTETEHQTKTGPVLATKSDQIRSREHGQGKERIWKGRSWPSLASGPRESAMSTKTPATLSPMIRSLLRLWCHESTRTYSDRLLTKEQRFWFSSLLHELVEEFFCKDNSDEDSEVSSAEQAGAWKNTTEVVPDTNATPLTATAEQQEDGEHYGDEPDDSMAIPNDGHNEDVDATGSEVEELSAEEEDEEFTDGLEPGESRPDVEEGEDKLDVQDDQGMSRETTLFEGTLDARLGRNKVTFDDRNIGSHEVTYRGPLISFEQLAFSGEDLTDIVFCKHFNASVTGRESNASEMVTKNYLECADSILEQGIKRCLASYNSQMAEAPHGRIMNLVTFREALQHAARLSRALATPGGHALLLSSLGYGRRSLTKVTAYAACYKFIEVQRSQFQSQEDLRQQIKLASFIAGLQGKPVVLFVPEDVNDESMQDICSLMCEGTCPGLYTPNELSLVSNQLLPGGKRGARRAEGQDVAQDRYFRRVKSHIHVVVCLKYTPLHLSTSAEENQLYRFPALVTRSCCVDIYRAWTHDALVNVAEKVLEEEENVLSLLPLKRREKDLQCATICSIMAHVHLSSRSMVERLYGVKALKFYSPDTYLDFVDLFRKICKRLSVKEKGEVAHLDKAIRKVDEATTSLNKMQRELDQLSPVFEASKTDVQVSHETVEACQKEYANAKEKCKNQELDIELMQGPIEILKKEAQAEFEKVNPLFDAAWRAIDSLNIYDVEEIRSYRTPPEIVTVVVNAVCLLFDKEQTWEEGKLLLNRSNFFKDLEFYNMKEIPEPMFRGLRRFYDDPKFRPDIVQEGSMAARSLCMWVRAVYEFCLVYRALEPKRMQLAKAEAELEKAKSVLGEMRVRCNAIKQELESNIQQYKDSVKHSRSIEKQIQNLEAVKAKGASLVESLSSYSILWHGNQSSAKERLLTAPGDALVTAAAVCYLGPLVPDARDELFSDWLRVCNGTTREPKQRLLSLSSVVLDDARNKNGNVDPVFHTVNTTRPMAPTLTTGKLPLREDVSLQTILSTPNEIDEWKRRDLPSDQQALQNVLILRSCGEDRSRAWPLLVDPHNQAELWVQALHQADQASSRPETGMSDRSSSRHSGRSSVEFEASALDDSHPGQSGTDDFEPDPHFSDNEVDQFLQSLKDPEEHGISFLESVTPANTTRTERSTWSAMTAANDKLLADKLLADKLAEAMGIHNAHSPRPEELSFTPLLNLPEHDILVVQADDPQLVSKLHVAVKKGLVTLVTHVERRRWNKSLQLLLMRQTFTNTEGVTRVYIGNSAVNYHPSFRLYLSSSLPLFMPGDGQYPLPFSKVSTISMGLSRQGLCDMLLLETLKLERPEFDGPLRSLERDVSIHKQQIANAKELILGKVVALGVPLLKDSGMLDAVIQSREMISTAEERCQEAEKMKTELLSKQNDFLPVAQYGALLFVVMSEMHKLHPFYRYPLDTFIQLYHDTIAQRNRGKKSSGSPAARGAELISALSRKIFERISWSLFQDDNYLFPFLLAVEKLMNSGALSRDEWKLFSQLSTEFHSNKHDSSDIEKPHWVRRHVWHSVDELELLPAFKGLKTSVAEQSEQWREYFTLPPVLLGATPGEFSHLTVFQKALLWKTFQRDQLFHVCQDIVLYQMGASMTRPIGYDLEQLYPFTSQSRPVVFLLPPISTLKQGKTSVLKDPVTDVINLARAHGKDHPLLMVTLGDVASLERALNSIKMGMKAGCWVILENCHLAAYWSEEFVHELQTIITMRQTIAEEETELQYTERSPESESEITEAEDEPVHPEFRLWLTTQADLGLPLPAVLIQHGIKVACEAKENFKESVQTNFHVLAGSLNYCTPIWGAAAKNSLFESNVQPYAIYKLAYLHSALLERRKYGEKAFNCPYQWFQADLLAGLHVLRDISRACHESLFLEAVEEMLGYVTYGGHVTNGLDLKAVESIAYFVVRERVEMDSSQDDLNYGQIDAFINKLPEAPSCQRLGLIDASYSSYQSKRSSGIADLVALYTGHSLTSLSFESCVKAIAEETIHELSILTQIIQSLDLTQEANSAVAFFIQRELVFLLRLLEDAVKDLDVLNNAFDGCVAFTPGLFHFALSLGQHQAPSKWLEKPSSGISVARWLERIGKQVKLLAEYYSCSPLFPCSFSLGAFVHPQAFLACVLMDHARSAMKSVYSLEFSAEVLHQETACTSPPSRGVYLSGLKLTGASWDTDRGLITELPESRDSCELPIVWLKPIEVMRSRAPSAKGNTHDSDIPLFDCPLLIREDWRTDLCTLVTSLSLPSIVDKRILKQRRVAIVSIL